jgi:hypothetical protein
MVSVWSIDPKQLRLDFDVPRYSIKCQPLKHLNPTDRLAIADWLLKFRAAAGADCAIVFSAPVLRTEFRIHFQLTGNGFWDELDGMSEVEFFDDLYAKYLTRRAFINGVVASFIISHVEWEKEPALARCIRDLPGAPGWGSTGDGRAMYDWLVKHGSTDDAATQERLVTEWSHYLIEARLTKQGLPRTLELSSLTRLQRRTSSTASLRFSTSTRRSEIIARHQRTCSSRSWFSFSLRMFLPFTTGARASSSTS